MWFYNYLTGRLEYFNVEMDNSSSELVDYFIKKTPRSRVTDEAPGISPAASDRAQAIKE